MAREKDIRIKRTRRKEQGTEEQQPEPRFAGMQRENEEEQAQREAEERRKARKKKRPKKKKRLIVFLILLVLLVLVITNWSSLKPDSVWTWINVVVTGGETGDKYPVQIEGSNVLAVKPIGNYLLVVKQNTLTVYNQSAGTVFSRTHSFADPIVDVSGNCFMMAETGGNRIEVQKIGRKPHEMKTEKKIVTAAVADNGCVAAVTTSDKGYVSEIKFFDTKGDVELTCKRPDLYLTGIDLRHDARQMTAIGLAAHEGTPQSTVLVYSTSSEKNPKEIAGNDVMLCDVRYLDGDTVAAVGDDRVWIVKGSKKEPTEVKFEDRKLLSWTTTGERIGVVLQSYGATDGGELTSINKSGKTLYTAAFSGDFRSISPAGREFFLLAGNQLMTTNSKGEAKYQEVVTDALRVCRAFGNDAAVQGLTTIERYEY